MRPPARATPWLAALALAAGAAVVFFLRASGPARPNDEFLSPVVARDTLLDLPDDFIAPLSEIASTDAIEPSSTSSSSERTALEPATPEATAVLVLLALAADDGEPLAGLLVRIRSETSRTRRTDASGRIELPVLPELSHRISVLANDDEVKVSPLAPGERREIVLPVSAVELHGRVLAQDSGTPIGGVELALASWRGHEWKLALESDAFGSFRARVPHGAIELVASAPGWARWVDVVVTDSDTEVEAIVRLARAPTLVVRAVDEKGSPFQRARVKVIGPAETEVSRPMLEWEGACDSAGVFEVADALVGEPLWIVVDAEKRRESQAVAPLEPGEYREVELELGPQVVVAGKVLDQDGEPVYCKVWMVAASRESGERYFDAAEEPEHEASTDVAGHFRIPHVRPGRWWIGPEPRKELSDIESLGYHSIDNDMPAPWARRVEISEESEEDLLLVVERNVVVEGSVLGHRNLSLTRLTARSLAGEGSVEGICSADGSFLFELGPGPHELVARHPWQGSSVPALVNGETRGLVVRLPDGIGVRGRVLGVDGMSGLVKVSTVGADYASSTETSSQGAFDLGTLAAGRYRFVAITDDRRVGCTEVEVHGSSTEVELAVMGEITVHWEGETNATLSLTWNGVEIHDRANRWKGVVVLARSPAKIPAPVGIPLELSLLGSRHRSSIVVPESGRLEVDFREP